MPKILDERVEGLIARLEMGDDLKGPKYFRLAMMNKLVAEGGPSHGGLERL